MENAQSSGDNAKLYLVPMNLWTLQSGINLQHTYPQLWKQQRYIIRTGCMGRTPIPPQPGALPWEQLSRGPDCNPWWFWGSGRKQKTLGQGQALTNPSPKPHLCRTHPVMQHLPFLPLLLPGQIGMGQINNDNYAHQMLWRRVSESPDMLKDKHVSWSTSWGNIIRTTSTRRELVQHRRANTGPT